MRPVCGRRRGPERRGAGHARQHPVPRFTVPIQRRGLPEGMDHTHCRQPVAEISQRV